MLCLQNLVLTLVFFVLRHQLRFQEMFQENSAEMLFTGDFIDAKYAKKIGLINHIVSKDNLDDKINEIA